MWLMPLSLWFEHLVGSPVDRGKLQLSVISDRRVRAPNMLHEYLIRSLRDENAADKLELA